MVGLVTAGALGGSDDPDTSARTQVEAGATTRPAESTRSAVGIEPFQALVVTVPARSGDEITTRRLTITGYVVGVPMPIRVSLEARGNREIDSAITTPTRSSDLARPQRAGRFQVTFDLPNPRPNGNMVVAVAIIGPDGRPIDGVRRRIRIGRILDGTSPATTGRPAARTRTLGEDGLMGGLVFDGSRPLRLDVRVTARRSSPANRCPDDADQASLGAPMSSFERRVRPTGWRPA